MLQIIRVIAWAAIAVGVSSATSEVLIVPVVMVTLGALLLKISEVMDNDLEIMDKEAQE